MAAASCTTLICKPGRLRSVRTPHHQVTRRCDPHRAICESWLCILFRRHSVHGNVEAVPWKSSTFAGLNPQLHQ
jgi:hypothetical protein